MVINGTEEPISGSSCKSGLRTYPLGGFYSSNTTCSIQLYFCRSFNRACHLYTDCIVKMERLRKQFTGVRAAILKYMNGLLTFSAMKETARRVDRSLVSTTDNKGKRVSLEMRVSCASYRVNTCEI